MAGNGFFTSSQVFRKDHRLIIAKNRHLASIAPIVLAYTAAGYVAGTVLARNTNSGIYQAYDDTLAASGVNTAACVLLDDVAVEDFNGNTSTSAQAITKGELYYDNMVGIDSNGITDLGGKIFVDGFNNNIFMF